MLRWLMQMYVTIINSTLNFQTPLGIEQAGPDRRWLSLGPTNYYHTANNKILQM